ncbi:hypothetical protein ACHAXA_011027 [Cyclostephanos tholiformis]|uniref:PDZ domain-containing protein n=1 Tax=Cyclostephanos tholiformis TaxID=382380 RepID=A0ABD3RYV5_9STRA
MLNISLECHADTNTSYLEGDSDAIDARSAEGENNTEDHTSIEVADGQRGKTSNVVKVADFSNSSTVDALQEGRRGQESPFRAAFRRGAREMSNRLPPIMSSPSQMLSAASAPTSESLKRLTPGRFQRSTASTAFDKAATTTASLLPQFARQCFSFEDTTVDDDIFLAAPPHGEGGVHPTTHEYYGLTAVASFVVGERDDAASDNDHHHGGGVGAAASARESRASSGRPLPPPPHRPVSSGGVELDSPFRVIRESRTWAGSLPRQEASSFDVWSPSRGSRPNHQHLGNDMNGTVETFSMEGVKRDESTEKDWKKIEMERGDGITLLACLVEHLSSFENKERQGSRSDLELEKVKLIVDSIKKISAIVNDMEMNSVVHDTIVDSNGEDFACNHQMRSDVIDTLFRSHEFALEAKRSCQSAKKWLQSIGCPKSEITNSQQVQLNDSRECDALRARLNAAEYSLSSQQEEISRLNEALSSCRSEIGRLKSSSFQSQHQPVSMPMNKSILSSSSSDSDSGDNEWKGSGPLVLCSSRPTVKLTASQDDSFLMWEKDIEHQMNLESRKEILLLKAALEQANRKISALENIKYEPFPSDIEPIDASGDDANEDILMKIAAGIENDALEDTPVSDQEDDCENNDTSAISSAIKLYDPALEKELEEYRQALIVSLEQDRTRARADSIMSSDDPIIAQDLSKGSSSDRKMINVQMIDGENFTTEWSDLVDLPPPPDHDLHSPIVEAVISKWSNDNSTQSALLGWLEDILNGSKLVHSVPSLKLSGLDHQTRDGFVMHVLPLLLHRKDVHLHLTTRAHRITSYDIAVSVTPTFSGIQKNDRVLDSCSDDVELRHRQLSSNHHLMAFQATKNGSHSIKEDDTPISFSKRVPFLPNPFLGCSDPGLVRSFSNAGSISTAVTSPMSNLTPTRGPQMTRTTDKYLSLSADLKRGEFQGYRDEYKMTAAASPSLGDDLSVGSSAIADEYKEGQRQSGIIGSISGALGLLSRRKASPVQNEFPGTSPTFGRIHNSIYQTPKQESSEDELPYHRIVSAPPGKIGISFVEYRGHAMVSNVSEDSPLVGWVFPSDVLIAVDDIPVSGLRTREIVKLLTDRVKQQRNLRMVSAVAMNELTRPTTL